MFEDCESDTSILGVFASKESATQYKNDYIREFFDSDIEDGVSDDDLEGKLRDTEFNIQKYGVTP